MKKFISLALVLVMMMSICVFPAHAVSDPGDGVEPLYAVTTCARCGGAVRFVAHYNAVQEGSDMITYDLYECIDCGAQYRANISYG